MFVGLTVCAALALSASAAWASHYRIEALDVFGNTQVEALRSAGVETTEDYLRRTLSADEREALADRTGIAELEILVFARLCELLQIEGVGPRAAQLLRAGGVVSVADLAGRQADELEGVLGAVNAVEQLTGVNPTVENLAAWIEGAQSVPYHVR
jgi:predicted flap endonuclease-1-like 5' DNA nuclease